MPPKAQQRAAARINAQQARIARLEAERAQKLVFLYFKYVSLFQRFPRSARAHLFPQSVKLHYFCSGPICLDPICVRSQVSRRGGEGGAAQQDAELRLVPPLYYDYATLVMICYTTLYYIFSYHVTITALYDLILSYRCLQQHGAAGGCAEARASSPHDVTHLVHLYAPLRAFPISHKSTHTHFPMHH